LADATSALLIGAAGLAIVLHLTWLALGSRARAARAQAEDTSALATVVKDAVVIASGTAGVLTWTGWWRGQSVRLTTIVDTLATRKLPVRWLLVSITEKVAVPCAFDMMMRPAAPTTFSNFDLLPYTLRSAPGFPDGAVVRTDRKGALFPYQRIADHLGIFADSRAKELLIMPNGIRIVWLLAEADRARYGVFRQAEFGEARIDPELLSTLLTAATTLREAINRDFREAA
jgi:hypothetical protein